MAHFGDCCDPFMCLRMASNGYEAISLSSPRVLRTRVLPLGAELVPWSWIASFWVLDSRLTIFSLQLRLRFLLLLCSWLSLVFLGLLAAYLENVAASPNAIQMCVPVCICVLCKFLYLSLVVDFSDLAPKFRGMENGACGRGLEK